MCISNSRIAARFVFVMSLAAPLAALFGLATPTVGYGAVMFTVVSPAEQSANSIQAGSRFLVNNTITTDAVGAYVNTTARSGGVTTSDFTGLLWSLSGSNTSAGSYTLLEKVLIPTGTSVDANGFAYANFASSHTLTAGLEYVVSAWHGTPSGGVTANSYQWEEKLLSVAAPIVDPRVTFESTQFAIGTGLTIPTSTNAVSSDFGGNLHIAVPEPASVGLLVILCGTTTLRRRDRMV